MSGGVDSSTVAALLLAEHKDIFGVTMYLHGNSEQTVENAAKICRDLAIEHFVFDFRQEFTEKVMNTFKNYYIHGLTPNPCAFCNRDIKMSLLLKKSLTKGADLMATGHYARSNKSVSLMEAVNKAKDQSYFLSLVPKQNLQKIIFPLGTIKSKEETRRLAERFNLRCYTTKDSQDICFVSNNNYKSFLISTSLLQGQGSIIHVASGQILGGHRGIFNYTIGQRKGLGISYKNPLYVIKIDSKNNIIYVGEKEFLQKLTFFVKQQNWLADTSDQFKATVKLRSSCRKVLAKICKTEGNKLKVELLEPNDTPITSGQICALYDNEVVLGGGVIE